MNSILFLGGWDHPAALVLEEARQLAEEGRDPGWIEKVMAGFDPAKTDNAACSRIWLQLQDAPLRLDFAFTEPNDLEGIRAERSAAQRAHPLPYGKDELANRMLGAWLGRCCGCALGKPVECFMGSHNHLSSKERIKTYLLGVGPDEYPLYDYFPGTSPTQDKTGSIDCAPSQRENIQFMETDDDIRYTVLGQKVLLDHGHDFTSAHVMKSWFDELPYALVCTAETQAYRNYAIRYLNRVDSPQEIDWNWVATSQNPYREWIGAQIRADSWGYAAPGHPERAAEYAWRDARMSHVKNGIYGEMFVSAMIAAGFALKDPLQVVTAGLAEIPHRSRLYTEMLQVIEICRKHDFAFASFEAVLDEIYALLSHYHPVHTNNNAALVVASLLLGRDDFEKVITLAVMGGWDSDCNGATAGSIFGAMHGAGAIPEKWKGPLHDTLHSRIFGYHPISISECARRSVEIALLKPD